jgi:DNA-binding response OmpR family regulator
VEVRRVIYVDDTKSNLELFQSKFGDSFDFVTILGSVGAEEKILSMSGNFDVVILDIVMPVISGIELYKSLVDKIDTPIIFKSMSQQEEIYLEALKTGKGELLTAEMSFEEMRQRIENVASDFCVHVTDECKFYRTRRQLKRNDCEVTLTEIEARIVDSLCYQGKRKIHRDNLMRRVWGRETLVDKNTAGTHFSNLRKKLKLVGLDLVRGSESDYYIASI